MNLFSFRRSIGRDKNNTKNSTARSPSDSESPIDEDPFVNTYKNYTPTNTRLNGRTHPDSHPTRFSTFSTNAHKFNSDLPSECEYHEPWNTLPGRIIEQPRIAKTKTFSSRDRKKWTFMHLINNMIGSLFPINYKWRIHVIYIVNWFRVYLVDMNFATLWFVHRLIFLLYLK